MKSVFQLIVSIVFVSTVLAGGYGGGGGGSYVSEYDCGGSCGGGCGYGNPCGQTAQIIETQGTGGCGGYGSPCGESSRYVDVPVGGGCSGGNCHHGVRTSSASRASGYHKTVTTVVKEENKKDLKIIINKPSTVVHRKAYIHAQPKPVVQYHKQPYRESGYHSSGYDSGYDSGCGGGPCGGGSKIVKIIRKTTTYGGDACTTCGGGGYESSSYSQPTIVHKVTKILPPKIIKVVKVVDSDGGDYYDSGRSSVGGGQYGGDGGHYQSGGGYGGSGASAKAGAFAFASASAGAVSSSSGGGSGDYIPSSGGYHQGGRGCKRGCDEWKKK